MNTLEFIGTKKVTIAKVIDQLDWSQLCNVCKQKWGLAPPRSM